MSRFKLPYILFHLIIPVLLLPSCDSRNIVEPRFYDAGDIIENDPDIYDGRICFGLIHSSDVRLYILGSAGQLIKTYNMGYLPPGIHCIVWDWRDENGNKYPDGVYCVKISAGSSSELRCFEYEDPEDYLP